MRAEDFFRSAQPTTIVQDVREAVRRKNGNGLVDEEERRRQEGWSKMGDKVVGAEGD